MNQQSDISERNGYILCNAGEENSLIMNVRPVQADFHSLRKEGGSNPAG